MALGNRQVVLGHFLEKFKIHQRHVDAVLLLTERTMHRLCIYLSVYVLIIVDDILIFLQSWCFFSWFEHDINFSRPSSIIAFLDHIAVCIVLTVLLAPHLVSLVATTTVYLCLLRYYDIRIRSLQLEIIFL